MKIIKRTFDTTVLTVLIIIITFILCNNSSNFPKNLTNLVQYAPFVVIAVGMIIAWKFNYSRIFFILMLLMISYTALTKQVIMGKPGDIFLIISIILPINILIITFFKERGIISSWGILRLLFILGQLYIAFDLMNSKNRDWAIVLNRKLLPLENIMDIPLSDISLLLFLIAFALLIIRVLFYQTSMEVSFVGVLFLVFYMLIQTKEYDPFIFIMIGILFIVTIIKSTYFLAFYDELTRLPSRRALKQDMMKLGLKYTISMIDIDFFKKFNDKYGHDTGDDVLKLIASTLKNVRGGGKAYRYGGEEFTIIFPGKSAEDAIPYLEELRENIAKKGFHISGTKKASNKKSNNKSNKKYVSKSSSTSRKVTVTVSIGVAQKNDVNKTVETVLKAADNALYRAKKKGRNCVCK